MTEDELAMNSAGCDVDDLLKANKPLEDALAEVAAIRGIKLGKLCEYHAKRRGPSRRAKGRVYDAKRRRRAGK
jgi:hypothetical protein